MAQSTCLVGLLLLVVVSSGFETSTVFTEGEGGIAGFRIPGLVFEPASGHLLAFAEGRVQTCDDFPGNHHLVAKVSNDSGRTWGQLQVILIGLDFL